ncbi:sensor histidine kinase [Kaistia sp. 32K]|uniref:sensor histidine kinase n=1 Tax=Kaistia sp. 32K TaxID=2795690 RepID=UPI0019152B98|nr:HAMP domain-containing sensor histidine kinase [Kaistia sp. 32K]BCP53290.1 sensor histidine kinase [Kaistia sp. 32K]
MQMRAAAAGDSQTKASPCAGAEERCAAAAGFRDLRAEAADPERAGHVLDHALLAEYARDRRASLVIPAVLIPIAALCAATWVPLVPLLLWAIPALLLHAWLAAVCGRTLDLSRAEQELGRRKFVLVASEVFYGIGWASFLILLALNAPASGDALLVAVTLLTVAVGAVGSAGLPAAGYAACAPIALAAVTLLCMRQDPLSLGLAALCLIATLACLAHAKRLHDLMQAFLKRDVDNHKLTVELESARAKVGRAVRTAEEANLAKSRFLATMNHELRTPLNAILGFSEVMKDELLGPLPNRTYRDYAADIHQSGGHLLSLINEILELSGFEAGSYQLREEPVQLAKLAEECMNFVRSRAESREQTLSLATETDLPPLLADARGTRQVVLNLLSNAIKFAPPGGQIDIQVGWTAGGGQYVSIRDNGPGIPAEEMPNLLSAFGQGEAGIRKAEQGSGMGLAIVEAITRLHGGTFELRSAVDQGTEAIVCFPRARVMEPRMVSPVVAEPTEAGGTVVRLRSAG